MDTTDSNRNGARGASPIIGLILMVAIVVILAGIMTSGLVSLGQEPTKNVQGGAALEWDQGQGTGEVQITYVTRGNTERLEIRSEVLTNPGSNSVTESGSTTLTEPGQSVTLSEGASNADEDIRVRVTAVAFLGSGEKAVVAEETRTI